MFLALFNPQIEAFCYRRRGMLKGVAPRLTRQRWHHRNGLRGKPAERGKLSAAPNAISQNVASGGPIAGDGRGGRKALFFAPLAALAPMCAAPRRAARPLHAQRIIAFRTAPRQMGARRRALDWVN
jgi:hypothetical protein